VPNFAADFNLSVTVALRDQLAASLESLESVELSEDNLLRVATRGGVYQLFENGHLVYVGKSTGNLRSRLGQHRKKLSGRVGGVLERTTFKCVYVAEDLDALAPEKMLIGQFRRVGQATWNTNGFGNKDPGKNRDTSVVEAGHFDSLFPIDLDLSVTMVGGEIHSLADFLVSFKKKLPYNFRFQSDKATVRKLEAIDVSGRLSGHETRSVAAWIDWLVPLLPAAWVVVALPGYLIAYAALDPITCASRTGSWTLGSNGATEFRPHRPTYSSGPVLDESVNEEEMFD